MPIVYDLPAALQILIAVFTVYGIYSAIIELSELFLRLWKKKNY